MAKMVEIRYMAEAKELEKLNEKLERAQKRLEKKLANAVKYGVDKMDNDEHRKWLDTVPTENGFIINKADIKKNGAWYDLISAEHELEDVQRRIENAEKRYAKVEQEVEEYHKEVAKVADLKAREELQKLSFEQEKKEWAKDGITLKRRYAGFTPSGKKFCIDRNSGFTMRSFHCYTLYLEGTGVVFTSGEFWRAYGIVKNS